MNLNQITLPALDIDRSVDFYRRMGFHRIVGAPRDEPWLWREARLNDPSGKRLVPVPGRRDSQESALETERLTP